MAQYCSNNDKLELTKTCILLVFGIPATGKSSLVGQLVSRTDQLNDDIPQYVHVCADDFYPVDSREQLDESVIVCGEFNWKEYRKMINCNIEKCLMINSSDHPDVSSFDADKNWRTFVQKMCIRNNNATVTKIREDGRFLSDSTVIIVDDNLPLQSMRYEYYQLSRKYTIGFCEVLITCDLKTALLWNEQRSRPIPTNTVITMATTLEPPDPAKHHWEEMNIVLKSDDWWDHGDKWNEVCGKVYQLCSLAMKDPIKPTIVEDMTIKEESRRITRNNMMHQIDQKLRECVSGAMKKCKESVNSRSIADEAMYVNRIKKLILDEYRRQTDMIVFKNNTDELLETVIVRFNEYYYSEPATLNQK